MLALTVEFRIRAFTLTELLVTIAILGVLSSLVLTAIVKGKGKSRDIQCKNNVRQHGLALQSFTTDGGVYPIAINPGFRNGAFTDHSASFYAALKDHGLGPLPQEDSAPSVYLCPSGARQVTGVVVQGAGLSAMYGYNAHGLEGKKYGLLGLGGSLDLKDGSFKPTSESQVLAASEMIAMGDGVRGWANAYQDSVWVLSRTSETQEQGDSGRRVRGRHAGRLNVVFCDNHVAGIRLERLFMEESDSALRMWNRDNQPHSDRLR